MFRRLILILALACSVVVPSFQLPAASTSLPVAEQKKDCVVYVTRTGHRYHQGWCRYLRQSKIPMSRSKAIQAGFTPCRVCGGSKCESKWH